jgi:hypothetical protein
MGTIASTCRVSDGPLQRLHAAERSAGDRGQTRDAERIEERALRAHHVGDGDHGKVGPVRPSVAGLIDDGPVCRGSRRAGSS